LASSYETEWPRNDYWSAFSKSRFFWSRITTG